MIVICYSKIRIYWLKPKISHNFSGFSNDYVTSILNSDHHTAIIDYFTGITRKRAFQEQTIAVDQGQNILA